MSPLDPIDIGVLAFLALHTILGIARGFVWQIVRVLALAAALTLSRLLQPQISDWLRATFRDLSDRVVVAIAYFGVFIAVFAVGTWLARVTRRGVAALQLSGIDRLLGAVLGLAKGAIWVILILIGLAHLELSSETRGRIASTRTAALAKEAIDFVAPFFPDEIRARVSSSLDGLGGSGGGGR